MNLFAKYNLFIDYTELNKQVQNFMKNNRDVQNKSDAAFRLFFESRKERMITAFWNHPVTQEIRNGPGHDSRNISGVLGGRGNLFSFIGFDKDQRPAYDLYVLLKYNTIFKRKNFKHGFSLSGWEYEVELPDRKDIRENTKIPWTAESWAEGIEKGLSGINHYIFANFEKNAASRSGWGLQNYKVNIQGTLNTQPYLSVIFKNFKDSLNETIS